MRMRVEGMGRVGDIVSLEEPIISQTKGQVQQGACFSREYCWW
jgi:hypothetical protein